MFILLSDPDITSIPIRRKASSWLMRRKTRLAALGGDEGYK
jgi:hypothetical protein